MSSEEQDGLPVDLSESEDSQELGLSETDGEKSQSSSNLSSQETRSYRDPLGAAGFTTLLELPTRRRRAPVSEDEAEAELKAGATTVAEAAGAAGAGADAVEAAAEDAGEAAPEANHDSETDKEPETAAQPAVQYPSVADSYRGFYHEVQIFDEPGRRFVVGIDGIIGAAIATRAAGDDRELLGMGGNVMLKMGSKRIAELNTLEEKGWAIECRMALSLYNSKQQRFSAEVAWFAYNPVLIEVQIMKDFLSGMSSRIASGSHPDLKLDQEQFERVISSSGRWHMTKDQPRERLPSGTVAHRRRRNLSDTLVSTALKYRVGCNIITWAFFAAVIALIYLVFIRK
ncbi:MAG: hypothetical protein FWD45_05855 [Coriobacteriia bacterium]|nr:hypothetical protein [Coriobacteriia bacterium]